MKIWIFAALALSWVVPGAPRIEAQATPPPSPQSKPSDQQKPAPKPAESNPFPEDTNTVPVMPTGNAPAAGSPAEGMPEVHAPASDSDPVRSPEDPAGEPSSSGDSSSSSFAGIDRVMPPADTDTQGRKGRGGQQQPEHQESAKDDENVGAYYLSEHNWKAALSRFESAAVLDPENPEVYWGLGEAERHLGKFADAKASYLKLVDYDPDSKHGKEARKILKDPELANAPTAAAIRP